MENIFSFVIIKPDATRRGLVGEVISRLESRGIGIIRMEAGIISRATAETLYEEHKDKPYFEPQIEFMTSGMTVAMLLVGPENCVQMVRKMIGKTNGTEAEPGTIRGDLSSHHRMNIIHASDSDENVRREAALFFPIDTLSNRYF